jgi:TolA-binding protein
VKPESSSETKVGLDVALSKPALMEGDVIEATARVTNLTDTQLPTVVAIVGVPGGLEPRIDQLKGESEQRLKDVARLKDELNRSNERETARQTADERAAKFYELVRQGKRSDLIAQWEQIKGQPLSKAEAAMFSDAAERAKNEIAAQLYQQGMDKVRVQRWQEAATAFEESIKFREDAAIGPSVRLGLAEAYRHLNRQKEAIPVLALLAENAIDKEVHDDALYLLAWCQMEVQAWNDAKNTWRTLIRRFPESRFTAEGKLQLAQLQLTR